MLGTRGCFVKYALYVCMCWRIAEGCAAIQTCFPMFTWSLHTHVAGGPQWNAWSSDNTWRLVFPLRVPTLVWCSVRHAHTCDWSITVECMQWCSEKTHEDLLSHCSCEACALEYDSGIHGVVKRRETCTHVTGGPQWNAWRSEKTHEDWLSHSFKRLSRLHASD